MHHPLPTQQANPSPHLPKADPRSEACKNFGCETATHPKPHHLPTPSNFSIYPLRVSLILCK
jgi:hypothetical protein